VFCDATLSWSFCFCLASWFGFSDLVRWNQGVVVLLLCRLAYCSCVAVRDVLFVLLVFGCLSRRLFMFGVRHIFSGGGSLFLWVSSFGFMLFFLGSCCWVVVFSGLVHLCVFLLDARIGFNKTFA